MVHLPASMRSLWAARPQRQIVDFDLEIERDRLGSRLEREVVVPAE
jgi:hypothetical protein